MTLKQQRAQWKALAPVRAAIKGWAFAADSATYLAHGEARLASLPPALHAAGEELLAPIRESIARSKV